MIQWSLHFGCFFLQLSLHPIKADFLFRNTLNQFRIKISRSLWWDTRTNLTAGRNTLTLFTSCRPKMNKVSLENARNSTTHTLLNIFLLLSKIYWYNKILVNITYLMRYLMRYCSFHKKIHSISVLSTFSQNLYTRVACDPINWVLTSIFTKSQRLNFGSSWTCVSRLSKKIVIPWQWSTKNRSFNWSAGRNLILRFSFQGFCTNL